MMGGEHGKLKFGPPEGHTPVYESLMPKEKLRIEPKFHLGDIPKGLVAGPPELRDISAFVPHPVEASNVRILVTHIKEIFLLWCYAGDISLCRLSCLLMWTAFERSWLRTSMRCGPWERSSKAGCSMR